MVTPPITISRVRLIVYGIIAGAIIVFLFTIAEDLSTGHRFNRAAIEALIAKGGVYSYLIYTVLVVFCALTPIASSTLWLIAGYLFNPIIAIFLTVLAEFIGAVGNYYIGRYLIRGLLHSGHWPTLAERVSYFAVKMNPLFVFTLGLIPFSTTNATAYAASLAEMPLRTFLVAWTTGIGILATVTILLGHSASTQAPVLAISMAAVVVLLLLVAWRALRRKL